MKTKKEQVQTAVRLPASLLSRIDKLATRMSKPGITFTRAAVLRLAATKGVEQLERKPSP